MVGGYGGVAGEAVQGVILKTSDGGKSWIDQSTDIMSRLFGIDFIDSLNGWAVAGGGTIYDYGMILHTNDGGKSWNIQKNNSGLELYNVQFINKDDGWAYGFDPEFNSSLIYTKDGGKNWNGGNISIVAPNSDMKFIDANTGWLIGSFGEIYRTENGGLNWIEESSHTFQFLLGIDAIDAEHIWSVGVGGTILYKEQISSIKYASLPQRYLTKPEIYNFTLYPNPFNSSIKIKFEVAKPIILDLSVYDINGRIIDKIVTGELKSGVHIFTWDSKIISSGIYFFEVSSEKFRTVGKCILVK